MDALVDGANVGRWIKALLEALSCKDTASSSADPRIGYLRSLDKCDVPTVAMEQDHFMALYLSPTESRVSF